jgi:hypothetical protein
MVEIMSQKAIENMRRTFDPPKEQKTTNNKSDYQRLDVEAYLKKYGREVVKIKKTDQAYSIV